MFGCLLRMLGYWVVQFKELERMSNYYSQSYEPQPIADIRSVLVSHKLLSNCRPCSVMDSSLAPLFFTEGTPVSDNEK